MSGNMRGYELMIQARLKGDAVEVPPLFSKNQTDVNTEVNSAYKKLLGDKESSVLLFDSCIHTGDSLSPVVKTLREMGMMSMKIGVANRRDDASGLPIDFSVLKDPYKGCYPFHKDRMINKTFQTPHSKKNDDPKERQRGRRLREEIKRIMTDYLSTMPKPGPEIVE
jgi:hypothetical protein